MGLFLHLGLSEHGVWEKCLSEVNRQQAVRISVFMKWVINLEDLAYLELSKWDSDCLEIVTSQEWKPEHTIYNWFYQIYVESVGGDGLLPIAQDVGYVTSLCGCKECKKLGVERNELFSVWAALTWVGKNCPSKRVNLWVDSARLVADSKCRFIVEANRYRCPELRKLDEEICEFASTLDATAFRFKDELKNSTQKKRSVKSTV